ncbi:hypothetical protein [Pinibacter soli]|uniref:DUF4890 domain-containing protein n=1 Tax=Pinibacter soli TaxID=3044211 RepID=A0ABT6R781_9BACT|nr:hypothetical protein [Pinibacter soli]MDI3318424.1 hypothetical protein [Pinibacter soli]
MKKRTIVLAAFFLTGSITFAQSSKPPATNQSAPKHEQHKNVTFTAEQQKKLEAIMADTKDKSDAIKSNESLTKEQKQQQMLLLIQSSKQQSNAVLTAEQQAQLKSQRSETIKKRNANNY